MLDKPDIGQNSSGQVSSKDIILTGDVLEYQNFRKVNSGD